MSDRKAIRTPAMLVALVFYLFVDFRVAAQDFSRVAPAIANKLASSGRKSVAVVDFTDLQLNVTELGRYMAEEFQNALVNEAKGFKIIDRTNLKAILQENKLAATGIIDPVTARQLGRIAGVETLVTGSITQFGDSVRLSLKLLDASTAEVLATSSVDVPKTNTIATLSSQPIGAGNVASNTSPAGPVGGAIQRKTVKGITVELLACNNTRAGLRCDFSFINQDRDKGVGVFAVSAFDARGGQYQSDRGQIGNGQGSNSFFGAGRQMEARLITGVSTPAFIMFEQIPRTSSLSALYLEMFVRSPDTDISVGSDRIDFRNIGVGFRTD
jgi:curli biogenesis system outer membrane secretion channel CsgG